MKSPVPMAEPRAMNLMWRAVRPLRRPTFSLPPSVCSSVGTASLRSLSAGAIGVCCPLLSTARGHLPIRSTGQASRPPQILTPRGPQSTRPGAKSQRSQKLESDSRCRRSPRTGGDALGALRPSADRLRAFRRRGCRSIRLSTTSPCAGALPVACRSSEPVSPRRCFGHPSARTPGGVRNGRRRG